MKVEEINKAIAQLDSAGQVSDSYHTFSELYEHRHALFINLARKLAEHNQYMMMMFGKHILKRKPTLEDEPLLLNELGLSQIWKSRFHADGSPSYAGYFIMGIGHKAGKIISYHLPDVYWDMTPFADTLNVGYYDGHSSNDVILRLFTL